MTKRKKRLQQALKNRKTVSFSDLDLILKDAGFMRRQPRSGSSHYTYYKNKQIITVPYKRPFVKEVYVKRVLEIIEDNL